MSNNRDNNKKQVDLFDLKEWWEEYWQGMPEFVQEKQDVYACINCRFECDEDLKEFAKLIGQKLTRKTKSAWYPFKSHWGQNVNKVNTRVTLFFDLAACPEFSDTQKHRIRTKLSTRVDRSGVMRVVSQRFRTQKANRRAALEKLHSLLEQALKQRPVRKKTKVPKAAHERRLEQKRRRSQLKQLRSGRDY